MSDVESHECFRCSTIYDAGTRDACPKCGHAYIWSNGPPARGSRANGPRAGESEKSDATTDDETKNQRTQHNHQMRVIKSARKGQTDENVK